MYAIVSQLKNLPIVSLQTGQTVATTAEPLINPDNLEVLAMWTQPAGPAYRSGRRGSQPAVVLMRDIRQLATNAVLIDHEGAIGDPAEIVRLAPILEQKFHLPGCAVVSQSGQRLGKVEDYTINLQTHLLQKLYVRRPFYASFIRQDLIIDRGQIIDVKPGKVTVADSTIKKPALAVKSVEPSV